MYACTSVRWVMDRLCAHALAGSCCGLGLNPKPVIRASSCPSASTACGFGAQAFDGALAFNADIGAWNTASVSNMAYVCAAPGPGGAHYGGRARRGFDAARGLLYAAAPPMRARVRTRAGTRLRGGLGVGTAGRRGGSIHASLNLYMCVYASVCYTLAPTLSIYLYV
jgi:hypothetical protein